MTTFPNDVVALHNYNPNVCSENPWQHVVSRLKETSIQNAMCIIYIQGAKIVLLYSLKLSKIVPSIRFMLPAWAIKLQFYKNWWT